MWSNPSFLRIWLANAIDDFGTHISGLAIPLTAAISLGAGPFEMGLLAAAQRLPYFALGLFAGVLVDRRPRQPLMVLVNWLRAGLLALIPIAALQGGLSIELLYLVAVLAGAGGVVFDTAYVAWLPDLVERDELHDANGKMEATYASAQAAGPGIAGLLVGLVSAPFAIAVDTATFALSALLIRTIRPSRPEEFQRSSDGMRSVGVWPRLRGVFREIQVGLQVVWRDPYIRALTSCSGLVSLFGFAFLAVYILFMTGVLGLSPTAIGLILGAGGVGAVIGSTFAVPISRRLGFGPAMIWAQIIFAITGITVPIAVFVPTMAVPMLALSEFAQYGALAVYNIGQLSLRQVRTATDMQGRVTASSRTVTSGAALAGSLLGGLLGDWIGLGETLVVGVAGMAVACILVIASPLRSLRDLPEV
ncbi:MAG: MFS transporter [Chloroflexia bacterium]|nr:MFS transporter [Chloroflexia bacterium]